MTAIGRAAPGGRRGPGWALPDATAPAAALAASLLGLILVGALAGAGAGAWVVQVAVKQLVGRPRPPAGLALSHATGFAFPSGHATDAAAVYGMLAVLLARFGRGAARVAAWTGAAGLIALVGLSRLYLGVHWLSRVVLVIQENQEYGQIIGSRRAPFLNGLAAHGTLLTRYHAVTHPSLPHYVVLVAGSPLGIRGDCRRCHRPGRNLVDQLERAHISWKAYYQGLPAPCSAVAKAGAYATKTDPFAHLASAWRPGTVLVVTFDEGTTSRGLQGRGGGHVATVVAGPGVAARHDPTPSTHYALLRSIEHRFGLPPLRNAGDPATRTIPAIAGPRRPT